VCADAVYPVDHDDDRTSMPVYLAPQQRPRLTDAEIDDLAVANTLYSRQVHIHSFARAIEAKIRSEQA